MDEIRQRIQDIEKDDRTTIQRRMLYLFRLADQLEASITDLARWAHVVSGVPDVDETKVRISHTNLLQAQRLLRAAAANLDYLPPGVSSKRGRQARKGDLLPGGFCKVRENAIPKWKGVLPDKVMARLRIEDIDGEQLKVCRGEISFWIPRSEVEVTV